MKKLGVLLLSALMVLSLTACGSGYKGPKDLTETYSTDIDTLDYVITALQPNHEINANLVDGLLENNSKGEFVPALAESYEKNEDASVWTFKLRKGVKWVTSTGEEYGEVTADDFVAGLQHAADFGSETGYLLNGLLVNFTEYSEGKVKFEEVGIKAIDDYTVEYTLTAPTPYFFSLTTYAILYPVNRQFLESKGVGCKLGAPDKAACEYGTTKADSILYNGGYILTTNDVKSKVVLTKNENYWDADKIYMETVTRIFDDGSDPYSGIKGFEQGTYAAASLKPAWENYKDYTDKYADNLIESLPNSTAFYTLFNFNRPVYEITSHKDDAEKANVEAAILNENFRKAYRAAFDRVAQLMVDAPKEVATATLRNINNFQDIVVDSKGKNYGQLVTEAYKEMTGEEVNLLDGQDPWLNKESALKFIEAAKKDGIKFPVSLDVMTIKTNDRLVKMENSMKQSIEANTDGQIIINVHAVDMDTLMPKAYRIASYKDTDYDINTFTGWGPDYTDPKTFVDIFSPTNGYLMDTLGLGLDGNAENKAIAEKVGLYEFEELYRAADKITDNLDARYAAFAKADAYLVAHAIDVPVKQQARGIKVQRVVPFTRCYSNTGLSEYKYKGLQLQDDIVTKEQYEKAYKAWKA
ncbi:MAG: peptide ABC transporter substrate-binding protein [Erysipelotrichaceae bacterium]